MTIMKKGFGIGWWGIREGLRFPEWVNSYYKELDCGWFSLFFGRGKKWR